MTFLRRGGRPYREQLVGAARVVRPRREVVSEAEVERLRQIFAESKSVADREAFWLAVQHSKQPGRWIEDQPDTFVVPRFVSEIPIG